jgi:class 3 adenylate cyclase
MINKHVDRTVMFVDIAGSTKLYQDFGDTLAQDSIARTLIRMSEIIKRHKGIVVKFIGDEILCYFNEVNQATTAAFKLNEMLDQATDPNGINISIRIGMHLGQAIIDQNDIYGDTVNVAAAMREIAKSRQIIATEAVVQHMPSEQLHLARRLDASRIKGRQEKTTIYEIIWEDENSTQMLSVSGQAADARMTRLQLTYRGREISILEDMPGVTLGRDPVCTMIVQGNLVSRQHASIEYRKGKFVYRDTSTNGSYIMTEEGRNLFIRREEVPLLGVGKISLGTNLEDDEANLIQYYSR